MTKKWTNWQIIASAEHNCESLERVKPTEGGAGYPRCAFAAFSESLARHVAPGITAIMWTRYHWYQVDQVSGGKLCSLPGIRYLEEVTWYLGSLFQKLVGNQSAHDPM